MSITIKTIKTQLSIKLKLKIKHITASVIHTNIILSVIKI